MSSRRQKITSISRRRVEVTTTRVSLSEQGAIPLDVAPDLPTPSPREETVFNEDGNLIAFYDSKRPYYQLSNFWPHHEGRKLKSLDLWYDGKVYPTSEHLYQCLKFSNETPMEQEWQEKIRTASTPGIARHLGHLLKVRRYGWQQQATDLVKRYEPHVRNHLADGDVGGGLRCDLMRIALQAKYDCSAEFREVLHSTAPYRLMEDADNDWGWASNWLGLLLEELRDRE